MSQENAAFPARVRALALIVAMAAVLAAAPARAENGVGGHFGFVLPLISTVDGETTDISDDFKIGFPMGITIKKSERLAFDLELVALVQDSPLDIDLTVHPGVLFGIGNNLTAGVRAAFEVEGSAWGLTPLIARGFPIRGGSASYFVELDFPIRVLENAAGGQDVSVGLAFHSGIGF